MVKRVSNPPNKSSNYRVLALRNNLPKMSEKSEITSSPSPLSEKCENKGCTENKSEKHSETCLFRNVNCVLLECSGLGPLNGILNHVLEKHKNDIRKSIQGVSAKNTSEFIIHDDYFKNNYYHKPLQLSLDGKAFFLNIYRLHSEKLWVFYVTMIGSIMESKDYIYGLAISNGTRVSFSSILTHTIYVYDTY